MGETKGEENQILKKVRSLKRYDTAVRRYNKAVSVAGNQYKEINSQIKMRSAW